MISIFQIITSFHWDGEKRLSLLSLEYTVDQGSETMAPVKPSVLGDQVVLEPSHAHSFTCCLRPAESSSCNTKHSPQRLKIVTTCLYGEKEFLTPAQGSTSVFYYRWIVVPYLKPPCPLCTRPHSLLSTQGHYSGDVPSSVLVSPESFHQNTNMLLFLPS